MSYFVDDEMEYETRHEALRAAMDRHIKDCVDVDVYCYDHSGLAKVIDCFGITVWDRAWRLKEGPHADRQF